MTDMPQAPERIHEGAQTHIGRFRGAIAHPDVTAPGGRWRLKEWNYLSLVTETHFVAFAVVQLGYVANLFCYVVHRQSGAVVQTEALAPFGAGLTMATSPLSGATTWARGEDRVEITPSETGWRVALSVRLQGAWLRGAAEVTRDEGLSLVFPLAPARLAYTYKEAGMRADVQLTLDDQPLPRHGLATLDWTRSAALRTTRWNWASTATQLPDGRRFGLNLSAHVYDDASGASQENAVWLDGALHLLGGVRFTMPRSPTMEPWHIEGDGIDIGFTPLGARQQDVNLGLIRSRFIQPYGHLAGRVRLASGEVVAFPPAFGVVEDHLAVW